jgi:hypothetical protein
MQPSVAPRVVVESLEDNHKLGALGTKLPDVRGARAGQQSFNGTWASKKEWDLPSTVKAVRDDFDLPTEVTDAEKAAVLLDGSLNHRTLSARVRFFDFEHTFEDKKRERSGLPLHCRPHASESAHTARGRQQPQRAVLRAAAPAQSTTRSSRTWAPPPAGAVQRP